MFLLCVFTSRVFLESYKLPVLTDMLVKQESGKPTKSSSKGPSLDIGRIRSRRDKVVSRSVLTFGAKIARWLLFLPRSILYELYVV